MISPAEEVAARRAAWRRVPNRLFAFLLSVDLLFVAVFALAVALGFVHGKAFLLVNLDVETNPPSWYASTQVFVIAIAYLMLGSRLLPVRRKASDLRRLWLALGIGFTFLSMDEGAALHERIGRVLARAHFNVNVRGGGQWIFFYLLLAAILVVALRKELRLAWRDWRTEVAFFIAGFAILAAGGVGSEMVEWLTKLHGTAHFVQVGVEEGLEMIGASLLALGAYRVLAYVLGSEPDAEPKAGA